MNFYQNESQKNQYTIFKDVPENIDYVDFVLRLDLIGVLASVQKVQLSSFLSQAWTTMYPSVKLSQDLRGKCLDYYNDYRLGLKMMSEGEILKKPMAILWSLVITTILLNLPDNGIVDVNGIETAVYESLKGALDDEKAIRIRARETLQQYFNLSSTLSQETIELLKQGELCIQNLYDSLHSNLSSLSEKNTKKMHTRTSFSPTDNTIECQYKSSSAKQASHVQQNNGTTEITGAAKIIRTVDVNKMSVPYPYGEGIKFVRVMCLLFRALQLREQKPLSKNEAIRESWSEVFEDIRCDDFNLDELKKYISNDPDLNAIDLLLKFSLKGVRNERIVRRIIVCICVNQVISMLPHNSTINVVISEALTLYSSFDILSIGMEENDIEEYARRFVTSSNTIDDRYSTVFWRFSDSFIAESQKALDYINSKDRTRRRYWEEKLEEKDEYVNQLQEQINTAKIDAIYEFVKSMTGSSYDYVLSRLYRFAYGYDELDTNSVRLLLNNMFQLFRIFGIDTDSTEYINHSISEIVKADVKHLTIYLHDIEDDQLIFPGWKVAGDQVLLPIANRDSEEEKNV